MGSTFKVVDTIAGLENGVHQPVDDPLRVPGPTRTTACCGTDWNPNGHGVIDLTQAIVQSADTYFYKVGYDFYCANGTGLEDWAQAPGLRAPDGHRHARRGRRPRAHARPGSAGPTRRRRPHGWRIDSLWKPGDSINLAIGQGDLLATPLQVAVNYAAIANGGYLVTPHLGLSASTRRRAARARLPSPRRASWASRPAPRLRAQRLREAASTPAGTSYGTFGSYPVAVAGKTGTAQVPARATTPGMQLRAGQRPQVRGGRHDRAGRPRRRAAPRRPPA